MQTTIPFSLSEADEFALEKAQRQARLQQLTLQAERVLAESRAVLAAHLAERQRMAQAIEEARAQLAQARTAQGMGGTSPGAARRTTDMGADMPARAARGDAAAANP